MSILRPAPRGFTLIELLVSVAIAGGALVVALLAWGLLRGKAETTSAARTAELLIHQARMTSIYRGINHFVVLDPTGKRLEIYADSGTTPGSFDAGDPRVGGTHFSDSVALAMPASPTPLTSPIDGTSVAIAWSLPDPDSAARWGSTLKGVMTTPTGLIQSAEAVSQPIGSGVFVLSNRENHAAAVAIRGRTGGVRAYRLESGAWRAL